MSPSDFYVCASARRRSDSTHLLLIATFVAVFCCSSGSGSNAPAKLSAATNCNVSVNGTCPLYFLVLAPYPDSTPSLTPSWKGGPAVVPAAMVAKDLINSRQDILENYTIEFVVGDSGCNISTKAINNVTGNLFYSGVNIVGIIGPGCSESSISIGHLVTDDRLSLVQIAPTATSPSLTNTMLFPNTFRPIVSALGFVNFYMELIKREGYRRVGALYEDSRKFQTDVYNSFEAALEGKNDTVVELQSYGLFEFQSIPIENFRIGNTRVIFVFSSIDFARKLLCFAFHEKMIYPNYQFIFSNRRPENFIEEISAKNNDILYNCNKSEMQQAIEGMIFADYRLAREDRDDNKTAAGISYNEFTVEYRNKLRIHLQSLGLNKSIETDHHSNYFDATWALALSLNNSMPRIKDKGLSLSNYRYRMPAITQIVRDELLKLTFEGMRGRVEFSEDTHGGEDVTIIDFNQTFNTDGSTYTSRIVGFYDPSQPCSLTVYPNASIILATFDFDYLKPHTSLGVLVMIAVLILFVILFACQIASVVWREHRTVKASSPRLNHFIFLGCYFFLVGLVAYTSNFVFRMDTTSQQGRDFIAINCGIIQWTGTTALSLVLGVLLVKTWRIYCIFIRFNSLPMKRLGDKTLLPIALIPFTIDVAVNTLWSSIDPWEASTRRGEGLTAVLICTRNREYLTILWILLTTIPKALMTIVLLYFAIVTRQVHRREYKQTKSINIFIFSLFILIGVSIPLIIIVTNSEITASSIYINYVFICILDLGTVVLCLVLLLLPPLIPLINEKLLRKRVSDSSNFYAVNSKLNNQLLIAHHLPH